MIVFDDSKNIFQYELSKKKNIILKDKTFTVTKLFQPKV